jgi:hypothetical protein
MVLISTFPLILRAQTVFMHSAGGSGNDQAWSITQSANQDLVVAGVSWSFGSGDANMYIVNLGPDGTLNWQRNIGGAENESARSVIHTADGGFLMAGSSYAFGQYSSMMVVKLTADGLIDWEIKIDGFSANAVRHDIAHAVVQTSDGGYVIAGETYSPLPLAPWGTFIYLVKLDAIGQLEWSKAIGGPHNPNQASPDTRAYDLLLTNEGDLVLAGYTAAFGAGYNDMFLVKLDASGNHLWSRTIGGVTDDRANSVIQTNDGGFLMTGETGSFGIGGGYKNVYIVKLDALGGYEWSRSIGGNGGWNDIGYSAVQTIDGDYVVAGFSPSFNSSIYLNKLDQQGTLIWSKTITGSSSDFATSLIVTSDNTLAFAGFTYSFSHTPSVPSMLIAKLDHQVNSCNYMSSQESTIFPTNSLVSDPTPAVYNLTSIITTTNSNLNSNGSLIEVCLTTGFENQDNAADGIQFHTFPNPADHTTSIHYSLQNAGNVQLRLLDGLGKELELLLDKWQNSGEYQLHHDLQNLSPGLYFLQLQSGAHQHTRRLVISR